MSKQLTKQQLVAALEASHVSYQILDVRYQAVLKDLHEQGSEVGRLREHVIAKRYVRPIDRAAVIAHDNYARALLSARETAMRTGKTVRVG